MNNNIQDKIIFETDEESAQLITVTGWVSKNRCFYNEDERMARYDGCTHRKCECGEIFVKYGWCKPCSQTKKIEKYNKKPFKEWDGITPLYSDTYDKYFFDSDQIECFLEDEEPEISYEDLRLTICEGVQPSQISDDYWEDIYPEDMYFEECASEEVQEAFEALNEALAKEKPWSWHPGEFRTEYKMERQNETV